MGQTQVQTPWCPSYWPAPVLASHFFLPIAISGTPPYSRARENGRVRVHRLLSYRFRQSLSFGVFADVHVQVSAAKESNANRYWTALGLADTASSAHRPPPKSYFFRVESGRWRTVHARRHQSAARCARHRQGPAANDVRLLDADACALRRDRLRPEVQPCVHTWLGIHCRA